MVMVKKVFLFLVVSVICNLAFADEYLQIVSLISNEGGQATFVSAGISKEKKEVERDGICIYYISAKYPCL